MNDWPFLEPGTKVKYLGTGEAEFGIVIHCWHNDEINGYDCYVAFFGDKIPTDKLEESPYILRYATSSLIVI